MIKKLILFSLLALISSCGHKNADDAPRETKTEESPPPDHPQNGDADGTKGKDLAEALNEPGMGSNEIPENRSAFIPFKHISPTEQEAELRLRSVNALWNTPLGQMFYAYIFDPIDPLIIRARSHEFTERILSAPSQLATRLSVLHYLVADLYVRKRLTEDVIRRLAILESDIYQESQQKAADEKDVAIYYATTFILASLPFGSRLVRQEARRILSKLGNMGKRVMGKEIEASEDFQIRKLFSREVFKDYDPSIAASVFFSTFGPFSMIYWGYEDWLSASIGKHATDIDMLNGLDALLKTSPF